MKEKVAEVLSHHDGLRDDNERRAFAEYLKGVFAKAEKYDSLATAHNTLEARIAALEAKQHALASAVA